MGNNRNHYLSEEMIDRYCDEYLKKSSKSITLKEDDNTNLLQMDELTQEITMVKNIAVSYTHLTLPTKRIV